MQHTTETEGSSHAGTRRHAIHEAQRQRPQGRAQHGLLCPAAPHRERQEQDAAAIGGWQGILRGDAVSSICEQRDAALEAGWHLAMKLDAHKKALAEALKLMSHYAQLLNMHDGGQRSVPIDPAEWVQRVAGQEAQEAAPTTLTIVPKQPSDGLLMSMAIRYDHGLGVLGYYDQPIFAGSGVTHAQRLAATITTMRQLHEEVVGLGFYSPEREGDYVAQLKEGKKC